MMETISITQSVPLARTKSNNERLPFDVLGLIFHQYSLESTAPKQPKMEYLLRVCKAWASAALGHKALWSNLNISIDSQESLLYWHHQVPLWIAGCSSTCLLDIKVVLIHKYSDKVGSLRYHLGRIVLDLTGAEGQIARRWRSLRAVGHSRYPTLLAPLLSFPTPNLINLEIDTVDSQDQCLPEIPVLERLDIKFCWLPCYPDLQNVTNLTISAEGREQFDEGAVSKAKKLVKLSAYCNSTSPPLRGDFPVLEHLHLESIQDEAFLASFSAPHLRTLSLRHDDGQSLYLTSRCPGIPFHVLGVLELDREGWSQTALDDGDYAYIDGISLVLNAAVNIKELRTRGRMVVKLVLELLEDLSKFLDHHFTLKHLGFTMEVCQGQARLDRIAAFRLKAMLVKD